MIPRGLPVGSGHEGTGVGPTAGIEPLENRTLLSWPPAPFGNKSFEGTIYVNQFGNATITGNTISRRGEFNGYKIFFDDPGKLEIKTSGALYTEIAYYKGEGNPTATAASWGRFGVARIRGIRVGPNRDSLYLGVRAQNPKARGTYDLFIRGVPEGVNYELELSPDDLDASSDTDINSPNDYDFYTFKTTRAGNWTVTVSPDEHLDATMIVFDSEGNPVYGSFTTPINAKPTGVAEKWVGRKLKANATYYVRVDSRGDTWGDYDISVKGMPASHGLPRFAANRIVS